MSTNEDKIQATKSLLFFGNLILAFWVALGTASFWLLNPLFGWLFLGFSAFIVLVIIRRLLCNSCYYCKSCTKGFAKLSKLFLGGSHIPGISKSSTIGMTATIYLFLTVIPSIGLINALLEEFNLLKLLLLICLLSVTVYNLTARAKKWYP